MDCHTKKLSVRLMGWFYGHSYDNIRKVVHLDTNRFRNNFTNLEFVLWEDIVESYEE